MTPEIVLSNQRDENLNYTHSLKAPDGLFYYLLIAMVNHNGGLNVEEVSEAEMGISYGNYYMDNESLSLFAKIRLISSKIKSGYIPDLSLEKLKLNHPSLAFLILPIVENNLSEFQKIKIFASQIVDLFDNFEE